MSVPTSGTYQGAYLYQVSSLSGFGSTVTAALDNVVNAASTVDPALATQLAGLVVVADTLATDQPVTFSGQTLDIGGYSLSDATILNQGPSALEIASSGTNYVLSDTPIAATTIDTALTEVIGIALASKLYGLVGPLDTLKTALDNAGAGQLTVINEGVLTGSGYVPPCFVRGTRIETARGLVAVEDLVEDDMVIGARGGASPVVWIGRRRVDLRLHDAPETVQPIRIRAGALGGGIPLRDLRVSPDHALFLDGVLVPAGLLVNGGSIVQERLDRVEYFHVELPDHDVLLAEGAAAESYLDTGNRQTFSNTSLVALVPDFVLDPASVEGAGPCAPMVLEGEILEAIRSRLNAMPAGSVPAARGGLRAAG